MITISTLFSLYATGFFFCSLHKHANFKYYHAVAIWKMSSVVFVCLFVDSILLPQNLSNSHPGILAFQRIKAKHKEKSATRAKTNYKIKTIQ